MACLPSSKPLGQVPAAVRRSQAEVQVLASRPAQPPPAGAGPVAELWPGMSQRELVQAAAPLHQVAVLSIRWEVVGAAAWKPGWGDASAGARGWLFHGVAALVT